MTNPTPANPITLDLRGLIPTPLHRPRLAALACWLFAAHHLFRMMALTNSFAHALDPQWYLLVWTPQLLCLCLGAVLLDIADIAGPASELGRAEASPFRP